MEEGRVSQFSPSLDAIKDQESPISKYISRNDREVYNNLFSQIGPLLKESRKNQRISEIKTLIRNNTDNEEDQASMEMSLIEMEDNMDEAVLLEDKRLKNQHL